jgi:hypothetical protein
MKFSISARWSDGAWSVLTTCGFYEMDLVDHAFEYLKRKLEELYLIPAGLEQNKLA